MSQADGRKGPGERERVVGLLRTREAELRGLGVAALGLFGSVARGQAGPASDVDLLLDAAPDARMGLRFLQFVEELGDDIGRPVDLAFRDALRPWLRQRIEAELVRVF